MSIPLDSNPGPGAREALKEAACATHTQGPINRRATSGPVRLTPSDEASIAFYFRAQSLFERSTSGPMLHRADTVGHDSNERRLAAPADDWHWRPPRRLADGREEQADQTMQVHESGAGAGGYEVEHPELVRFAQVSRRMLAVERLSPRAKVVLEAYYGDRGSRWAQFGADRLDPKTNKVVHVGAGPGSIAALYGLTETGEHFLARERTSAARQIRGELARATKKQRRKARAAAAQGPAEPPSWIVERVREYVEEHGRAKGWRPVVEDIGNRKRNDASALYRERSRGAEALNLTDDELLANAFALEAVKSEERRRAMLDKMRDEAERLLVEALGVWWRA